MIMLRRISVLVVKTVDNIAGLYDKVKIDDETKKVKKKALKVLLYSLIALVITFFIDIVSTWILAKFQEFIINLEIDPYDGVFGKIMNSIEVALILSIIVSSLIVIGNKRCRCFNRSTFDDSPVGPYNPTSIWPSRHRH